jgi:hypothetical protein
MKAMIHSIPNSMKYIIFLVLSFHTTYLYSLPGSPAFSIVPTEKRQRRPAPHIKNTITLITKKITGTKITLKLDPTNSAAASSTAIEICRLLHMQSIAIK